jgi:hypothetical protein
MELENSFLELEKLDLLLKKETQKLAASSPTEHTIHQIQSSVQHHFTSYQEYIDKISIFCMDNNPETTEKLAVKQEQLQLTRDTYRKRLAAVQLQLQADNKNELLGNTEIIRQNGQVGQNLLRNRKKQQSSSKTSNFEQLKSLNRTMSESVTQSQKVLVNLKEQEEENLKTEKNVTDMKSNIDDSEHLITKYKQRARTDQILMKLGVFTFFLSCAYIILKRVFGFFL